MGMFDRIQDNAKAVSMQALDGNGVTDDHTDENTDSTDVPVDEMPDFEDIDQAIEKQMNDQDLNDFDDDDDDEHRINVNKTPRPAASHAKSSTEDDEPNEKKSSEHPASQKSDGAEGKKHAKSADKDDDEDEDERKEAVKVTHRAPAAAPPAPRAGSDTLGAYASQLQMSGTKPFYSTTYMNFRASVFANRVEYTGSFGKIVLPVDKIAWIKLRIIGTGIIIETTTSKRVVMIVKPSDRVRLCDAILRAQELTLSKGGKKVAAAKSAAALEQLSASIRELEKLADLRDKGVLTDDEFNAKKKQILGL